MEVKKGKIGKTGERSGYPGIRPELRFRLLQTKESDVVHELLVALCSARCIAAHSFGAVYGMSM
jgi:hypothetical protein